MHEEKLLERTPTSSAGHVTDQAGRIGFFSESVVVGLSPAQKVEDVCVKLRNAYRFILDDELFYARERESVYVLQTRLLPFLKRAAHMQGSPRASCTALGSRCNACALPLCASSLFVIK